MKPTTPIPLHQQQTCRRTLKFSSLAKASISQSPQNWQFRTTDNNSAQSQSPTIIAAIYSITSISVVIESLSAKMAAKTSSTSPIKASITRLNPGFVAKTQSWLSATTTSGMESATTMLTHTSLAELEKSQIASLDTICKMKSRALNWSPITRGLVALWLSSTERIALPTRHHSSSKRVTAVSPSTTLGTCTTEALAMATPAQSESLAAISQSFTLQTAWEDPCKRSGETRTSLATCLARKSIWMAVCLLSKLGPKCKETPWASGCQSHQTTKPSATPT